jgi:hypothetical protein
MKPALTNDFGAGTPDLANCRCSSSVRVRLTLAVFTVDEVETISWKSGGWRDPPT